MEYVSKISKIISDVQGWTLTIVAVLTTLRIAKEGLNYQKGDGRDKKEAMDNIKHAIIMGGGIFMLIWFAGYVMSVMK